MGHFFRRSNRTFGSFPKARRKTRAMAVAATPERLEKRIALAADVVRTLGDVSTVSIDPSMIGPAPIVFQKSQIVGNATDGFVVKSVSSGVVEKWNTATNAWEDVSTLPSTANPAEMMARLQARVVQPGDRLRWHHAGSDGEKAFQVVHWDTSQDMPTIHPSAPARIQDVDVAPADLGQAGLSWTPIASRDPASYTLTQTSTSPDGQVSHETRITAVSSASLTNLKAENSHMFSLTATNAFGTSATTFGTALGAAAPGEVVAPIAGIKIVSNSSNLQGDVFLQIGDRAPQSLPLSSPAWPWQSNPGNNPAFLLINPPDNEHIKLWVRGYSAGRRDYTDYYYDPFTSQSGTNGTAHDLVGDGLPLMPGKTLTITLDYQVFGYSGVMDLPDGRKAGCSFKTPAQQGDFWAILKGTAKILAEATVFAASAYAGARQGVALSRVPRVSIAGSEEIVAESSYKEYDTMWQRFQSQNAEEVFGQAIINDRFVNDNVLVVRS